MTHNINSLTEQITLTFNFEGGLPTEVPYSTMSILPDWAQITYVRGDQDWYPRNVQMAGFRLLKPGKDGSTRLGVTRHEVTWLSHRIGAPTWVRHLVVRMTPDYGFEDER